MAINDIYRVTLDTQWAFSGDTLLNIFYYVQTAPGVDEGAVELATAFNATIVPLIQAIQSDVIQYRQLRVENIVPSADNETITYTPALDTGDITGDALPIFTCWAFRLNRQTSESRHGQKRFGGVPEGSQVNGQPTAGITPALTALAAALDDAIGGPTPATAIYTPRIFRQGRPEVTIPAKTIPAKIQAHFPIASVQFVEISTQNTRKLGVGS